MRGMRADRRRRPVLGRGVLAALLTVLALFSVLPVYGLELPDPEDCFYVNDWSGRLTETTKEYILEANEQMYKECGAQLVVVVTDFVRDGDLEKYCYNLFNSWGIGSKKENNGVLLLLSIGDDDYFCMQGKGLEGLLPSGRIGNLLEAYLEPDFAAEQYDEGVLKVFDALYRELCGIYAVEPIASPTGSGGLLILQPTSGAVGQEEDEDSDLFVTLLELFIFYIIIKAFIKSLSGENSGCLLGLLGLLFGLGSSSGGYRGSSGGYHGSSGSYHSSSGSSYHGSSGSYHSSSSSSHRSSSSSHHNSGGGGSSRGGGAGRRH